MCRNEELPIEPSKRWKATPVKTALEIEKKAREKDVKRAKLPGGKLSQFYVYCADPDAAFAMSQQKPRISHSAMALYDRVQTLKTFQGAAFAFGLLAAAVSSLFQEAVTEKIRKLLPPKEPLPAVKPLDVEEAQQMPKLELKPRVEPQEVLKPPVKEFDTISPPHASVSSVPNPLRPNKAQR
jgi:hypothetical protein